MLYRAVAMRGHAQLHPTRVSQVAVQHEFGLVVQRIDHDVVARFQVERIGDDVLSFAGGEEEADFVARGVDEPGELTAHDVGLRQHLTQRNRSRRLALDEVASSGDDRRRDRRDVGGIEVERLAHRGEVGAHAEWVVHGGMRGVLQRTHGRGAGSAGRERGGGGDERTTRERHDRMRCGRRSQTAPQRTPEPIRSNPARVASRAARPPVDPNAPPSWPPHRPALRRSPSGWFARGDVPSILEGLDPEVEWESRSDIYAQRAGVP
jgi:hypothetical protein